MMMVMDDDDRKVVP